jgi:hypothetical protein
VPRGQRDGFLPPYSRLSRPDSFMLCFVLYIYVNASFIEEASVSKKHRGLLFASRVHSLVVEQFNMNLRDVSNIYNVIIVLWPSTQQISDVAVYSGFIQ